MKRSRFALTCPLRSPRAFPGGNQLVSLTLHGLFSHVLV